MTESELRALLFLLKRLDDLRAEAALNSTALIMVRDELRRFGVTTEE
jgi:hypothetical protein